MYEWIQLGYCNNVFWPKKILINPKKELSEILSIEQSLNRELEKINIGGKNEANIVYIFEPHNYEDICFDAKKYFNKIVGKETYLNDIKGKFIDCIKENNKEFENIYVFKPNSDSKYKDKVVYVMDKLMLANGLKNRDI